RVARAEGADERGYEQPVQGVGDSLARGVGGLLIALERVGDALLGVSAVDAGSGGDLICNVVLIVVRQRPLRERMSEDQGCLSARRRLIRRKWLRRSKQSVHEIIVWIQPGVISLRFVLISGRSPDHRAGRRGKQCAG